MANFMSRYTERTLGQTLSSNGRWTSLIRDNSWLYQYLSHQGVNPDWFFVINLLAIRKLLRCLAMILSDFSFGCEDLDHIQEKKTLQEAFVNFISWNHASVRNMFFLYKVVSVDTLCLFFFLCTDISSGPFSDLEIFDNVQLI